MRFAVLGALLSATFSIYMSRILQFFNVKLAYFGGMYGLPMVGLLWSATSGYDLS
jgi:hypothetical protein